MADTQNGQCYDRQQAPVVLRCKLCGGEVYPEQLYYEIEGKKMCYDCLTDFARHYFLYGLKTAKLRGRKK